MAVKLSNSIPELLRCRILVVVYELVMVRSFTPALPLLPRKGLHPFLSFFSWTKMQTDNVLLPLIPPSRQKIGISKFAHHLRVDCVEFYFGSSS